MVRHEAQRKHQNFSHPKYYPTLALHSQFYYIHLRGGKFALESINYDHIPIATPSQNTNHPEWYQNELMDNGMNYLKPYKVRGTEFTTPDENCCLLVTISVHTGVYAIRSSVARI